MAKRDPNKTVRNKRISELTTKLDDILGDVLEITGYDDKLSLNAKIGGKHGEFLDIRHEVIDTPEQFQSIWLNGLMEYCNKLADKESSKNYELLKFMQDNKIVMEYVLVFLERTFLRKYEELTKKRPRPDDAVLWIGQENANYGILISPRFKNGNWENDGSEVRKFKPDYFTIGHILETGFVIPYEEDKIEFSSIKEYLTFFRNVIVRNSGSKYELDIAKLYCDYVLNSDEPLKVPLLIPEFRYGGLDKKHKYRLDFTIINPQTLDKYGFELSPWSSHGQLTGLKTKTQKQINDEARENFEKEMKKHKEYYRKHGVYSFIYTDKDLNDMGTLFNEIKGFLEQKKMHKQLKIHTLDQFYAYK